MKWCSDCGLEHIDSATSCADCAGALTGQQPPAPPVPVAEPKDHRTEVIDIAHLDDDQRLMLPQLLNGSDIPFEVDGVDLIVASVDREHAELLVAVAADADDDGPQLDPDEDRALHSATGAAPADWETPVRPTRSGLRESAGWLLFITYVIPVAIAAVAALVIAVVVLR